MYYTVESYFYNGSYTGMEEWEPEENFHSKENAMKRALEFVDEIEKINKISLKKIEHSTGIRWEWDDEAEYKAKYPYGPYRCSRIWQVFLSEVDEASLPDFVD